MMGCPEYDELRGELGRLLESSRNERVSSRISHMIDLAEAVEARRRDAQGRLEVCRAERWGERMDAEKAFADGFAAGEVHGWRELAAAVEERREGTA